MPSRMISRVPPAPVATTGTPRIMASRVTRPKGSATDGTACTSNARLKRAASAR
jgi:hypothetical protein